MCYKKKEYKLMNWEYNFFYKLNTYKTYNIKYKTGKKLAQSASS